MMSSNQQAEIKSNGSKRARPMLTSSKLVQGRQQAGNAQRSNPVSRPSMRTSVATSHADQAEIKQERQVSSHNEQVIEVNLDNSRDIVHHQQFHPQQRINFHHTSSIDDSSIMDASVTINAPGANRNINQMPDTEAGSQIYSIPASAKNIDKQESLAARSIENNSIGSAQKSVEERFKEAQDFLLCLGKPKVVKGLTAKVQREEVFFGSLTKRAQRLQEDVEYQRRVADYNAGKNRKTKIQFTEFIMDGVRIALPFAGQKMTAGYLKKESQSVGIMLSKFWQSKYFCLDLYRFVFKYAKNPTCDFTVVPLRDVIDVKVERDPKTQEKHSQSRGIFSLMATGDNQGDAYIFQVITSERTYRLQASTKIEQTMWLRAFAVLFELRARVLAQFENLALSEEIKEGLRRVTSRGSLNSTTPRSSTTNAKSQKQMKTARGFDEKFSRAIKKQEKSQKNVSQSVNVNNLMKENRQEQTQKSQQSLKRSASTKRAEEIARQQDELRQKMAILEATKAKVQLQAEAAKSRRILEQQTGKLNASAPAKTQAADKSNEQQVVIQIKKNAVNYASSRQNPAAMRNSLVQRQETVQEVPNETEYYDEEYDDEEGVDIQVVSPSVKIEETAKRSPPPLFIQQARSSIKSSAGGNSPDKHIFNSELANNTYNEDRAIVESLKLRSISSPDSKPSQSRAPSRVNQSPVNVYENSFVSSFKQGASDPRQPVIGTVDLSSLHGTFSQNISKPVNAMGSVPRNDVSGIYYSSAVVESFEQAKPQGRRYEAPVAEERIMMIEDFEEDDDDIAQPAAPLPAPTMLRVFSPEDSPRDNKKLGGEEVPLEPFGATYRKSHPESREGTARRYWDTDEEEHEKLDGNRVHQLISYRDDGVQEVDVVDAIPEIVSSKRSSLQLNTDQQQMDQQIEEVMNDKQLPKSVQQKLQEKQKQHLFKVVSPKGASNLLSNQRQSFVRFKGYMDSGCDDEDLLDDEKMNTVGYPIGSVGSFDREDTGKTRNFDEMARTAGHTELHKSGNDQNPQPLSHSEVGANSQIVIGSATMEQQRDGIERKDSQITMYIRGKSARRIHMRMSEEKFRQLRENVERFRLSVGSNQQASELVRANYKTQQLTGGLQASNHQNSVSLGKTVGSQMALRTSQPSPERDPRGRSTLGAYWGLRQLTSKNLGGALRDVRGFNVDMSDNESQSRLSSNSRRVKLRTFRLASKGPVVRNGGDEQPEADTSDAREFSRVSRKSSNLRDSLLRRDRESIRSSLERRPPGKKLKLKLNAYSQQRRRTFKSSYGKAPRFISSILSENINYDMQNSMPHGDVIGAGNVYENADPLKEAVNSTWAQNQAGSIHDQQDTSERKGVAKLYPVSNQNVRRSRKEEKLEAERRRIEEEHFAKSKVPTDNQPLTKFRQRFEQAVDEEEVDDW